MTTSSQKDNTRPLFPNFKQLTIEDIHKLNKYIFQFPPYSDFNFVSLWSYDTDYDVYYSWLNNNLVIRFRDYLDKNPFYSFLGNNEVRSTINQLLDYSFEQNLPQELKLIPEISIQDFMNSNNDEYTFIEDFDQNDYIIPLKETLDLININEHKRESYFNFINNNPSFKTQELDIKNQETQDQIMNLFSRWQQQRKKSDEEVNNEKLALSKLFKASHYFNLFALGIYINSELICFIIDERLKKPYVLGHFIKADLYYKGIYEVINKISAEMHYKLGYKYINIEQDLGIQGLRTSKLQRSPSFYLKKYTVRLNNI